LIQTNDDRVLAATARHLIGSAGGVEPEIPLNQVTSRIQSWKMYPRTTPDDFVEITALGAQGIDDEDLDWLILSIKKADPLPAYPLKLRKEPVHIGETVFLIGCPYLERGCKQNVYTGIVTEREFGNRFRYNIEPAVDIRGFSGAPIIDEKGYVVGVMTVWFDPKMSGDNFLEAGGEDIASIYHLVQRAN
jgi:S1-C subfamily serine protease